MVKRRIECTEKPALPATNAERSIGGFPVGSARSRAAARVLATARQRSEAEEEWDKELDSTGLAERIAAARKRSENHREHAKDWSPIYIPPGKENTVRGRLAARINAARERIRQHEAR